MKDRNKLAQFPSMLDIMTSPLENMERLQQNLTGGFQGVISIDIEEDKDEIIVTADIPGYNNENIELNVIGRNLTIRAIREQDTQTENEMYHLKERTESSVSRTVGLPTRVDVESAEATYTNGVLTVRLTKTEEDEDYSIEVN